MKKESLNLWVPIFIALLLLAVPSKSTAQTTLISTGAVWKYLDDGSDQGTAWRSVGFNDLAWLSGAAELGFGDGGEATTNTAGFTTYYYRRTFNVADTSSITNLRALLKRDDGAIVWINGFEAFRDNMPAGSVTSTTVAAGTAADDGQNFIPYFVNPSLLVNGANFVAVEVHQVSPTASSDVSFDFSLTANPVPTIAINSPTNGATLRASTATISGTAVPAGTNAPLVEVYVNGGKIGQTTNANFAVLWSGITPGSYVLTSRITDNGLIATSAPVNVTVEAPPASMLLARGSAWKYHNLGQDLGTAWQGPTYDDSAWFGPSPAPLGDNLEGAVQECASVIGIGPSGARFPTIYFRRTFNVGNKNIYGGLTLRLQRDDGAAVYLNGNLILADKITPPSAFANFAEGAAIAGLDEVAYNEFSVPATALVNGTNVVAVEVKNINGTSSDLQFDLEIEGVVDTSAPFVTSTDPLPNTTVLDLTFINVLFSEPVIGIEASDLRINTEPATSIVTNNPTDYTFYFPSPPTGQVQITWAPNHGITDPSPLANPFAGGSWIYNLDPNAAAAVFVINEFMADNSNGIRDDDGTRSDWIEIANIGTISGNLSGYYLTDDTNNLTKWRFPSTPVPANSYLLVWASSKDKTNSTLPLHTNFKLSKSPSFLGLVDTHTNVISKFDLYPAQTTDVSYGRAVGSPDILGFFTTATPRAQNSTSGSAFAPTPVFSYDTGIYTNASLNLTITAPSGTVRFTTDGRVPNLTNSTVYTGPITLSTNAMFKARVFPPDGSGLLPGEVVGKTYVFLDNTTAGFDSNLPLLIISTSGRPIVSEVPPGGTRTKGSFTIIDVKNAHSSPGAPADFQSFADLEYFGQTSIGFAKKPIRVELQDDLGNDNKISILGMPADSDYKIRNPYDDKTMLNDYLSAEYFEKMGHYSLRRRFVEAFVDLGGGRLNYASDYYGILVILENIKISEDRVNIAKIPNTATNADIISGGYIFKKDKDSVGDLNFSTAGGAGIGGYPLKMQEPKPNDLRVTPITGALTAAGNAQLNSLRNSLNRMEQAMYAPNWTVLTGTNHYSNFLDVDSFVDFHWLVEFTKQIDGYRISNYFYKDRNGKVVNGPAWDWNLAFGNANYLLGGQTNGWYYDQLGSGDHIWLRRLITGTALGTDTQGDPEFTQKIADRWGYLRTNIFGDVQVQARIDELATLLDAAANRDLTKYNSFGVYYWPNPDGGVATSGSIGSVDGRDVDYVRPRAYNDGTTNSLIGQLKKYMHGRQLWIDSQFTQMPTISATDGQVANGTTVTIGGAPGLPIYYTTDGTDPRGFLGTTNGLLYAGPITVNGNMRIVARAFNPASWKSTWSPPAAVTLYSSTPGLRITEIMFHAVDAPLGSTNSASDYDYIEVKNVGGTPLNVNRFSVGGDINFQLPNTLLAGGQSALIVKNLAAFSSRYNTNGLIILGEYSGDLNNAGGHLVLRGNVNEPILDFSYADNWYPTTDGFGFSLVAVNDNAPTANWGLATNWRPSSASGGSPGITDPAPPSRPGILVNEALTHTDPDADIIELYNPTASAANIGGWYLTDNKSRPVKYVIPANTTIPAGGYLLFYATNSFNFPTNGPTSFNLSSHGEEVWLFSGDGTTNLTGYAHGFDFGAAPNNVSLGRHVISTGEDHFVIQSANSFGSANTGPLVGPIAITEISYHPADIGINGQAYNNTMDEYIELKNITGTNVPLYGLTAPTNTWHLRDAVDFVFPQGVSIPAGGFALVVTFDPIADPGAAASFRSRNNVGAGIPLYGAYNGSLDNAGASVELARPDLPDPDGFVPYILADKVKYSDHAPWSTGADGTGLTLQRLSANAYGNDPANWTSVAPSPGANTLVSGTAPVITSSPSSRLVVTGTDPSFTVNATGTAPLHYQWQRNSLNVNGATNATLLLTNFQAPQAGTYHVLVYNSAGSALSPDFQLTYRTGLQILQQPQNRFATNTASTNFSVTAVGSGVVRYQWLFNAGPITATNVSGTNTPILSITNVQSFNEGTYTCIIRDDYDVIVTQPVTFSLIARPVFVVQPVSQTVVQGGSVTLSVMMSGSTPITYRWRKQIGPSSFQFLNTNQGGTIGTFTINNAQPSDGTNYNVAVSNLVGLASGGGASTLALITVLPDSDGDGIPDAWELANFGSTTGASAGADPDHDGMSNLQEYIAGTNPNDVTSYLKANMTKLGATSISFNAVSNRTYTVQYSDGLNPAAWQKLGDIPARTTTRTEVINDFVSTTNRFYRLVTPIQP